jgi:seryl-tRNA synthetase
MTPEEFAKEHQDFFVKIGGKKYKVVDEVEQKLSTYEITHKMLKEEKSFEEMAEERDVKIGTILSHIEKLLEEKVITKKDIEYLKPKTKEFKEMLKKVDLAIKKVGDEKLTPIFVELKKKYTFEDIRLVKVFL